MKHFVLMCLLLFIHTSQSEIYNLRSTEGADVFLICNHEGKVQWSKDRDGNRLTILTAESNEEIHFFIKDHHNRYSVTGDLSLHIKNLSLSDSGIYYCNANPTVNLTVTASDFSKPTASSNSSTEVTTPPPEISTTSVSETSNTNHSDQPKSTRATPTSDNISVTTFRSQLNTTVTSTTDLSTTSTRSSTRTEQTNITKTMSSATLTTSRATTSTTDLSTTSTRSSTKTEEIKIKTTTSTNSRANKPPPTDSFPQSIKIAAAVSGGVVFMVLLLLLWAWIKRKAALSNQKENIYETVEDSHFNAQPVPSQKPNDDIYYLAGDPDIVKLGQIKETDDHTYTLISQSKENITEQEEGVPLYSTINVDTINQP